MGARSKSRCTRLCPCRRADRVDRADRARLPGAAVADVHSKRECGGCGDAHEPGPWLVTKRAVLAHLPGTQPIQSQHTVSTRTAHGHTQAVAGYKGAVLPHPPRIIKGPHGVSMVSAWCQHGVSIGPVRGRCALPKRRGSPARTDLAQCVVPVEHGVIVRYGRATHARGICRTFRLGSQDVFCTTA